MTDTTHTFKELQEILGVDFKTAVRLATDQFADLKVTSPNSSVTDDDFKTILSANGVVISADSDHEQERMIIHRSPDHEQIRIAPHDPIINKSENTYTSDAYNEYNELKAVEITNKEVRNNIKRIETDMQKVLAKIDSIKNMKKTIINDTLIHDSEYLHSLFAGYKFLIIPANISKKVRLELQSMFIRTYITDNFNNKLIAFTDGEILTAYIIN